MASFKRASNEKSGKLILLSIPFIAAGIFTSCGSIRYLIMSDQEKMEYNVSHLGNYIREEKELSIVCYGDSITYGYTPFTGQKVKNPYPETLASLLQKNRNGKPVTVLNEGVPGWTTENAVLFIENRVLQHNPDLVILMFGINDSIQKIGVEKYRQGMIQIIRRLKKENIKILLLSPTPILSWKNEELKPYTKRAVDIAMDENIAFVDIHTHFMENYSEDERRIMLPDTVHFKDQYYPMIAQIIMGSLYPSERD